MAAQRDILIRIYGRPNPKSGYPADAELDDGSYFFGGELNIQDVELLKLALNVPGYGAKLGQYLCSPPIQRAFEKAYAAVDGSRDAQLRVRLCFYPDAWELHAYPWERMLVPFQGSTIPLAASSLVPFSRYIQLPAAQQGPIEDRPIKILFAVSNPQRLPEGLQPIEVETELSGLVESIARINDLSVTILPGRTPVSDKLKSRIAELKMTLAAGPTTLNKLAGLSNENDVVHILCHGSYDSGTAKLYLEDDLGVCDPVVDTAIQEVIRGLAAKPRLVYLSACQSAMQDPDDLENPKPRQPHPMVGLAPKLVEAGIPAVIAMQDRVEVNLAHDLAADFYSKLLEFGEVDRALSEARRAVLDRKSPEWAIPALFLRLREGRLFATDPCREALSATLQKYPELPETHFLPLEAVALKGKDQIGDWERASDPDQTRIDLWNAVQTSDAGYIVIAGDAGSGKSTLLERLARQTSTEQDHKPVRMVPLRIDLSNYGNVRATSENRIEALILDVFRSLVPTISEQRFHKLLQTETVTFRFLFDRTDALPDRLRRDAISDINSIAAENPRQQYILVMDCRNFRPWPQIEELLVIQPLSNRKAERFLDVPADPHRTKLLQCIRDAELWEFAGVPWLLFHMLGQVRQNILPKSRSMVLLDWLETALYKVADDGGRSNRARESLGALAWKMHSERRQSLQIEEAFRVLNSVRGERDYNLEDLLDTLVNSGIIVRAGQESIRFAYLPLQQFGAAKYLSYDNKREDTVEEIVATLGQPSRAEWWRPALALLAGMLDDPALLIQDLVYGASLSHGEQVFVAASCLLEYYRKNGKFGDGLNGLYLQVCAALEWRAKRANEYRVLYRAKAVEYLGLFRRVESVPFLAKIAVDQVRLVDGKPDYEYSQVRMSAIGAIRNMVDQIDASLLQIYPDAHELIMAWKNGQVEPLAKHLTNPNIGIQGVAAFALGDLEDPGGAKELYRIFERPGTDPATLWAITDALLLLEPGDVVEDLVLPMVREARKQPAPPVADVFERLIHLIGMLHTRDQGAREFVMWYLSDPLPKDKKRVFKGRAMVALGRLHTEKELLKAAARGDTQIILAQDEPDTVFLRRKAIEGLGEFGDLDALYEVRQADQWAPELDEAFFRAAEQCVAPGNSAARKSKGGTNNGTK